MTELLPVKQIKQSSELQPRASMHTDKIDEYTEAMRRGDAFPALTVFKVEREYYLVDGYHRFMAAQGAKIERVMADIIHGTMRDAILYSAGVNSKHGIQRTNEDKRRAVLILLRDKEWGQWNDTKISEVAHVSPEFVGKIRKSILPMSARCTSDRKKVERAGKVYTVDTSKIGKNQKKSSSEPVSGLGTVPKDHPNHGVGCAQPGSLKETDLPPRAPLSEQLKPDAPGPIESPDLPVWDLSACMSNTCPGDTHHFRENPDRKRMECDLQGKSLAEIQRCPILERQKGAAAQAVRGSAFTTGSQPRPITDELRPLVITAVKKTDAEAESLMIAAVRGNWTDKEQQAADQVIARLLEEGEITAKSHNEAYRALVLRACEGME